MADSTEHIATQKAADVEQPRRGSYTTPSQGAAVQRAAQRVDDSAGQGTHPAMASVDQARFGDPDAPVRVGMTRSNEPPAEGYTPGPTGDMDEMHHAGNTAHGGQGKQ